MKRVKILIMSILCICILSGCSKSNEEQPPIENNNKEAIMFENNAKNIAEGGKIARYKDTYYYSEIKDGGKLYSKSATADSKPVKINDDIPGSINVYEEKLYYVDYSLREKNQLVILDINDNNKREVIEEDIVSILIKEDKLIGIYRGEEGSGSKEGFSYFDTKITDLKTNKVVETYPSGYGQVITIDENRYLGFSTAVGNYISDKKKDDVIFPKDEKDLFITYLDENEKGILVKVEYLPGHGLDGIYWIYNDGGYCMLAGVDDTTSITPDEIIVNAVSIDNELFYFNEEYLAMWDFNKNKEVKIKDYKLEKSSKVYKFGKTIIILKEDGTWEELDSEQLKKEANSNTEEKSEEQNKEEVSTESKLAQMSDDRIQSYYKDYIMNIYDKYYSERNFSDTIEQDGISYAALKSPNESKDELIKSIQSYFTEDFLSDVKNRNDKIVVDGKEYLAITENEFAPIGEMETIKSKKVTGDKLNVEFVANWGGDPSSPFDCRVEFVDIKGIIKINKVEYDM